MAFITMLMRYNATQTLPTPGTTVTKRSLTTPSPTATTLRSKAQTTVVVRPTELSTSKPPAPSPTVIPTRAPTPVVHTVREGEMLGGIAFEYHISVEDLMRVNQITDPTTLQIGQQLLIPITPTPVTPAASAKPTRRATPVPTPDLVFHTIQPGDTMLVIAAEYDISVEALMAANPNINPNNMPLDQKLLIPPADGALPDPILWAPTAVHEVRSGDTILDLAVEYGSSVEDILATNPDLEPESLQIGQPIAIPLTRPKANTTAFSAAPANSAPAPALSAEDLAALQNGSPTLVGLEQSMIEAVNAQRQVHGYTPYKVDQQLTLMAWSRAQDMVKRGYFSHVTPEGTTLRDRFREQGLSAVRVGENIYLSVQPADQAVQATIGWFMGDAPHRRNILHSAYNRIGVGVAQGSSGWYTFVLVFAGE